VLRQFDAIGSSSAEHDADDDFRVPEHTLVERVSELSSADWYSRLWVLRRWGAAIPFQFDGVLAPGSPVELLLEELDPLIMSAFDGHNVCMMTYGQSGTGKSQTMTALLQQALRSIWSSVGSHMNQIQAGLLDVAVGISMIEIRGDRITDLLSSNSMRSDAKLTPQIRSHPHTGEVVITDTQIINLASLNEAMQRVEQGLAAQRAASSARRTGSPHRTIGATQRSRAGHLITRLFLHVRNASTGYAYSGRLSMVDLAGFRHTPGPKFEGPAQKPSLAMGLNARNRTAKGDRSSVNRSLSALHDVFQALQDAQNAARDINSLGQTDLTRATASNAVLHVPYRNSKLTHVLQDCLTPTSVLVLLPHIHASAAHLPETLDTLEFAARVRNLQLQPQPRVVPPDSAMLSPTSTLRMS